MNVLDIKNLTKRYGGILAVNSVTFSVPKNIILSIIGPNGAGKTTLFNLLTGFHQPDSGTIFYRIENANQRIKRKFPSNKSRNIVGLKPHQIARLGIVRTFQLPRVFHKLTVLENMLIATQHNIAQELLYSLLRAGRFKKDIHHAIDRAKMLLASVHLIDKRDEPAGTLSFGQQKLLGLAKALMTDANVLLLDEPTAGVHPSLVDVVRRLILENKVYGKTVILIEHNIHFVMEISDHIIVLDSGRKKTEGHPIEIKNNEMVVESYLGRRFVHDAA